MAIMRLEQVLLIASITGTICCKPQPQGENDRYAKILSNEYAQQNPHEYSFKFETSNGISVAETGQFEETGYEMGNLVKTGFYHYRGTDGKYYLVTYIADQNGYRPTVYEASNTQSNDVLPLVSRPAAGYVPKVVSNVLPSSVPSFGSSAVPNKVTISVPSTVTTSTPIVTKAGEVSGADTNTQKPVITTELPEDDEDRIGTKLLISLGGGGLG